MGILEIASEFSDSLVWWQAAVWAIGFLYQKQKKSGFWQMLLAATIGLILYHSIGAVYFYLIKNLYAGESVGFWLIVVQYCLITILPDFILCILAVILCKKIKPRTDRFLKMSN